MIISFAEILLTREVPAATQEKWLQTIHQDGIRLANIVDALLSISQLTFKMMPQSFLAE